MVSERWCEKRISSIHSILTRTGEAQGRNWLEGTFKHQTSNTCVDPSCQSGHSQPNQSTSSNCFLLLFHFFPSTTMLCSSENWRPKKSGPSATVTLVITYFPLQPSVWEKLCFLQPAQTNDHNPLPSPPKKNKQITRHMIQQ